MINPNIADDPKIGGGLFARVCFRGCIPVAAVVSLYGLPPLNCLRANVVSYRCIRCESAYLGSQWPLGCGAMATKQAPSAQPTGKHVIGPDGRRLTVADLPSADTRRWVVRRKAEVVAAVRGGLLSMDDACSRYALSADEILSWQDGIDRFGLAGLRTTRSQFYYAPAQRRLTTCR